MKQTEADRDGVWQTITEGVKWVQQSLEILSLKKEVTPIVVMGAEEYSSMIDRDIFLLFVFQRLLSESKEKFGIIDGNHHWQAVWKVTWRSRQYRHNC